MGAAIGGDKMTGDDVRKLSRDEKREILRGMITSGWPMGTHPKLTAYKILDEEFDAEGQWYWWKQMAEWSNAQEVVR